MDVIRNGISTLAWYVIDGMIAFCLVGLGLVWVSPLPEWLKMVAAVALTLDCTYSIATCRQVRKDMEAACRAIEKDKEKTNGHELYARCGRGTA